MLDASAQNDGSGGPAGSTSSCPSAEEHREQSNQLLADLREELRERSFAHVPAATLEKLLQRCAEVQCGVAHSDDLRRDSAAVSQFFEHWAAGVPQRAMNDGSAVYPFKNTLITHYYLGGKCPPGSTNLLAVRRSTMHDYMGPPVCQDAPDNTTIERVDNTTATDSDQAPLAYHSLSRLHKSWPAEADLSVVMRAFQLLLGNVLDEFSPEELGVEPLASPAEQPWEVMQTAFRVTKSAQQHGEPGPEGIHQDACVLTVVVMMNRENVSNDSGGNRIWSLEQACGKPTADDLASVHCAKGNPSGRLLWSGVLRERFDAVFLLDRRVKHEALPIRVADEQRGDAVRDVLTFEVRRHARAPQAYTQI